MEKRIVRIGDIILSEEEKKAIMEVCESNRITEGKKTEEFEKKWAEAIGTKYAVSVNSGTSGLIAGLYALKYLANNEKRRKVITSPVTFIATANAIKIAGLEPVFVDIDKNIFSIIPEQIEDLLKKIDPEEFLAIMPVHLMGYPCEMDKIMEIAKKYNLYVFEDAAQAHGTVYNEKKLGSFGDLSNFSFYVAHNVQVGEFGAVNTNSLEIRKMLRKIKAHGKLCECERCTRMEGICPGMRNNSGEEDFDPRYTHDVIGFNFKTNEFMSALAIERLKGMEEINKQRRFNVKYLNEGLKKYSDILQLPEYSENVSYLGYPIILKKGSRKKIRVELERRGVETRILFGCIPLHQPSFAYLKKDYELKIPNAEYIGKNGFWIGCHQGLSQEDLNYIIKSFDEILNP